MSRKLSNSHLLYEFMSELVRRSVLSPPEFLVLIWWECGRYLLETGGIKIARRGRCLNLESEINAKINRPKLDWRKSALL